ncbi:MAG: hypothetical protein PHW60_06870 [Kiritimatiellae bacterium]|nr:hypothetical protein [Kiritimatiellia bacterium]
MKEQRPENRKQPQHTRDTTGSALLAVLGISLILMLAGVTMVVLSRQSMHRIHRTVHYAQAQALAEAGIADMIAKLGTNYTFWESNACVGSLSSNGTYFVTTQPQTNGNVLITSDGIYMEASNRTIMELCGTLQTHWNELYDTNSAILSDGVITLETGAYQVNGNVHANSDINLGAGTVSGYITSGGEVTPSDAGLSHQPLSPIPPAGPFNFDSYLYLANNGGTYLEGNQILHSANLEQPATNGILYVNGDLTINGGTFTGTIVANGNINVNNNFTQAPFPDNLNMPSLLSTGTIDLDNKGTFNGVMYAKVNIIIRNKCTINGGVIAGGFTDIRNYVTINPATTGYPAWDPLNPEVPPEVICGGWLK